MSGLYVDPTDGLRLFAEDAHDSTNPPPPRTIGLPDHALASTLAPVPPPLPRIWDPQEDAIARAFTFGRDQQHRAHTAEIAHDGAEETIAALTGYLRLAHSRTLRAEDQRNWAIVGCVILSLILAFRFFVGM